MTMTENSHFVVELMLLLAIWRMTECVSYGHVSSFLFINFFISALHNVPFSSWTAAERGQSDWPFNGPESVVIVLPINNRLYGPQVFYEPAQKLLREGPAEDEEQSNRIR